MAQFMLYEDNFNIIEENWDAAGEIGSYVVDVTLFIVIMFVGS